MSVFLGLKSIVVLDAIFTKNADVTLATITGFTLTAPAGKKYLLRAQLFTTGNATAGVKIQWVVPTGSTIYQAEAQMIDGGTPATTNFAIVATAAMGVADDIDVLRTSLYLQNGTTAGAVSLQFAQQVSDVSNTSVLAGSWLEIWQLT
jgi:hypothetical protein